MSPKPPKLSTILIITLTTFLSASCVPVFRAPPPTSADYCDIDPVLLAQPPQHETVIEVWASAPRQHCLRAYAPWVAAQQNPDLGLSVKVRAHNVNSEPFISDLLSAAGQKGAPDIAFVYNDHLPALVAAGYLHPIEQCRQQPSLRDISGELWTELSPKGQAWGVPFEIEAVLLYYNKVMLQKLGWSKADVENFPAQVSSGAFRLTDLLSVAEEAIEKGVTQSGFAFIPRTYQSQTIADLYRSFGGGSIDPQSGQLVIDEKALVQAFAFLEAIHRHKLLDPHFMMPSFSTWGNHILLRDGVAHGRILFAHGYTSDWQQMVMDYANTVEAEAALHDRIGVALLPAGVDSQVGTALVTDLGRHVIFAEEASGRQNQDAACRLLIAMHTAQLPRLHANKASQFAPDASTIALPSYWSSIKLQKLAWRPSHHPDYNSNYSRVLQEIGAAVEQGNLSADEATQITIDRLQEAIGDALVVE